MILLVFITIVFAFLVCVRLILADQFDGLQAAAASESSPHNRLTPPTVKRLEDRTVPAVFTVNTITDPNSTGNGVGMVTNPATGDGTGSLRWCLNRANTTAAKDTIIIPSGMDVKLAGALPPIAEELAIQGAGYLNSKVHRVTAEPPQFRIFRVNAGIDCTITGVGIYGGDATGNNVGDRAGGGVYSEGRLSLANTMIDDCRAENGGGVATGEGGTVNIVYSVLTDNVATANGGGVYLDEGLFTVFTGVSFTGNRAKNGGGLWNNSGDETITTSLNNCHFFDNTATERGGGVYNGSAGALTITGGAFLGNVVCNTVFEPVVQPCGGGIWSANDLTLNDVQVSSNNSNGKGGGVYMDNGALTISDCEITNNTAHDGEAIWYDFYATYNPLGNGNTVTGTVVQGPFHL